MKKPLKKANASTPSRPIRLWKKYITHPKLMISLVILLILPVVSFGYGKYKDWDNAQMIKGLAKDFPQLVAEVESATGLDLEIKSNCMTTQEKFGSGVRTCEILAIYETSDQSKKDALLNTVSISSSFEVRNKYENDKGMHLYYRGKNVCGVGVDARGKDIIGLSCIIGVRDANTKLALELF